MPDFGDSFDNMLGGNARDRRVYREKEMLQEQKNANYIARQNAQQANRTAEKNAREQATRDRQSQQNQRDLLASQNLTNGQLGALHDTAQEHAEVAREQLRIQQQEASANQNLRYQQWLDTTSGRQFSQWKRDVAVPYLSVLSQYRESFSKGFVADAQAVKKDIEAAEMSVLRSPNPTSLAVRMPLRILVIIAAIILVMQAFGAGFFAGIIGLIVVVAMAIGCWVTLDHFAKQGARERTLSVFPDGNPSTPNYSDLYFYYTYYFTPIDNNGEDRQNYTRKDFATDLGMGDISMTEMADREFAIEESKRAELLTSFIEQAPRTLPAELPALSFPRPLDAKYLPTGTKVESIAGQYRQTLESRNL